MLDTRTAFMAACGTLVAIGVAWGTASATLDGNTRELRAHVEKAEQTFVTRNELKAHMRGQERMLNKIQHTIDKVDERLDRFTR